MGRMNYYEIIEKIQNGAYRSDDLTNIFQILIDLKDDSIQKYEHEVLLEHAIKELTEDRSLSFGTILHRISTYEQNFIDDIQNAMPPASNHLLIQTLLDAIRARSGGHTFSIPEDLDLELDVNLKELTLFIFNERLFGAESNDLFVQSIMEDNLQMFFAFINSGDIDLEARNYYNDSLLHFAAGQNATKILHFLVNAGLNINEQNDFKQTPLHTAIMKRQSGAAKLLIDLDADLTIKNKDNATPTDLATAIDDLELIDYILLRRTPKKVGFSTDPYGLAVSYNSIQVFRLLKERNFPSQMGKAELSLPHLAAANGRIEMFEVLLNEGYDINVYTKKYSLTPLFFAISSNKVEMVRFLLDHGANPNAGDQTTPLHLAIEHGNLEFVQLLVKHKADVNKSTTESATPLMHAIMENRMEIIDYLLDHDADVNASWKNLTPLTLAVSRQQVETVEQLIAKGAIVSPQGKSPLGIAILQMNTPLIELLLDHGACVDEKVINRPLLIKLIQQEKYTKDTQTLQFLMGCDLKDQTGVSIKARTQEIIQSIKNRFNRRILTFLLLAVLLLGLSFIIIKDHYTILQQWEMTNANVTAVDSTEHLVTYTYTVDQNVIEASTTVNQRILNHISVGDRIRIKYDPNKVDKTLLMAQLDRVFYPFLSTLCMGLLSFITSFVILSHAIETKRILRRKLN